ncbi:hypothetical protein [Pseudoclavibacter helvolus]|uniref:hypothetical protein n=1 Tax=Pseudoclavibacter helvolus TaxID=255205 RepID=UPI003C78035B
MTDHNEESRAELIAAALSGDLSASESTEFERMRAADPTIDAELTDLQGMTGRISGTPEWMEAEPSDGLRERVLGIAAADEAGGSAEASEVVGAGAVDAGAVGAGAVGAGAVGAGAVDAGAVDAGAVDAGAVDAGAVDAGAVEAGAGAGGGSVGAGARAGAGAGAESRAGAGSEAGALGAGVAGKPLGPEAPSAGRRDGHGGAGTESGPSDAHGAGTESDPQNARITPLRRTRFGGEVLLGVAAASLVIGAVGGFLLPRAETPPPVGEPGTLGAVEGVDFQGEPAGVEIDGSVVAHTWGTETLLTVNGLPSGEFYSVVVVDEAGEDVGSGTFLGSEVEINCAVNAAALREDVASVEIRGKSGDVVASAALPRVEG